MTNQEKYRFICAQDTSIPIYQKDWWLDVTTENRWDSVIIEKDNKIIAGWPYFCIKKYMLFNYIVMPQLTQSITPWIRYPANQKQVNQISLTKNILQDLIGKLPQSDYFSQNLHYSFLYWLPFYWQGFKQTTRYTYVIEDLTDLDKVFYRFRDNIKTDIRKAMKTVIVESTDDIQLFFSINQHTFRRQNLDMPYSLKTIKELDKACQLNSCRKILIARDSENRIHSAVYIVWDANSAYYLMGGGDPELRNSGATSLLLWEAIKFSATVTKKFDFEGSMIEPIERYFRAFGATPKPYFTISKTNSKALIIAKLCKEILS